MLLLGFFPFNLSMVYNSSVAGMIVVYLFAQTKKKGGGQIIFVFQEFLIYREWMIWGRWRKFTNLQYICVDLLYMKEGTSELLTSNSCTTTECLHLIEVWDTTDMFGSTELSHEFPCCSQMDAFLPIILRLTQYGTIYGNFGLCGLLL